MSWKPEGYSSLSPYLIVDDATAVIDFCTEVFGAAVLRRYERPDGTVMHAELKLDDSVLMIASASPEWPATRVTLHLYVPDVDAVYQKAMDAGAKALQPPVQKDDPDRRGGFEDPAGNGWWVGTQTG